MFIYFFVVLLILHNASTGSSWKRSEIIIVQVADQTFLSKEGIRDQGVMTVAEITEIANSYYARKHGYSYHRIVYEPSLLAHNKVSGTWIKVHALYEFLSTDKTFEWIILIDFDAMFVDLIMSVESLIEKWNNKVDILMPDDPSKNPANFVTLQNGTKLLNMNTGESFCLIIRAF